MKKIIIIIYLVNFIKPISYSQEVKRGNVWVFGYEPVVKFNFNQVLQIDTVENSNMQVAPSCAISSSGACISDTNGFLKFFTNGFIMYDSNGYGMQNGLYINCPKGNILANHYGGVSLFDQTSIIIPKKNNQYYVFSTGMSDSVANEYINHHWTEFDILNYSIVDMDSNSGKGKVVEKNIILADHQHYVNCALTAVKHANGKDWWLVKADCTNHRYQEFLVKEDTILGPFYQSFPNNGVFCDFFGEVYFSQDGKSFASSTNGSIDSFGSSFFYDFNRVELYDFDRCDGSLTYKNYFRIPYDTFSYPNWDYKHGINFSPDGKLLYMSNLYTIYQIDLEDTNSYNAILIHGPDTTIDKFPWYNQLACGADGKLYIGNSSGTRKYMSYIDKPNVKGLGCDFKVQGLWQQYTNLLSPPNMPNYGLGMDTSKICWPLSISTSLKESTKLLCYPNPASTILTIELITNKKGLVPIEMYSMVGEIVLKTELQSQTKVQINISSLPKGVYVIRCEGASQKVVVD